MSWLDIKKQYLAYAAFLVLKKILNIYSNKIKLQIMIGYIPGEGSDSVPRISLCLSESHALLSELLRVSTSCYGEKMKSKITQHKFLNNKSLLRLKISELSQKCLHAVSILDGILLLILWEPITAAYPIVLTSVVLMGYSAFNFRNF